MISNPIDEQALISKIVNQLSPDLQKALLDIAGVEQALSGVKNDVAGVKSDVGTTAQALTTETNQIDNKLETLTATNGAIDNTATAINQHTTGELDATKLALINALNDARDNGKAHTTSINDALETALINAVNSAKSHTTSQHTSTKSALTTSVNSARDNTKSHVTTQKTAVVNAVNAARDSVIANQRGSIHHLKALNVVDASGRLPQLKWSSPNGVVYQRNGAGVITYMRGLNTQSVKVWVDGVEVIRKPAGASSGTMLIVDNALNLIENLEYTKSISIEAVGSGDFYFYTYLTE